MILLVSAADDDHLAELAPELRRRGASVLWLDLAELPAHGQLTTEFRTGARPTSVLRIRDTAVDLSTVTAVWSRRPNPPVPPSTVVDQTLRNYASQETLDVWLGVSALFDAVWLPGPRWTELRATYKPLHLQLAADLGFEIPPTLVTNRPEDVLAFREAHPGTLISKTVHNRLIPIDRPHHYSAYAITEVVANRDLSDLDAVRHCPVTFQPYVDKRLELRVIVVGDRVFAVEIHSQSTHHTRHDWRRGDPHHMRYFVHALPRIVADRAVALVKRLDLTFGVLDLILTPDGRYVFLEINPNGAWMWLEQWTDIPILAAVADLLMSRETPATRHARAAPTEAPPAQPASNHPTRLTGVPSQPVRLPRGFDATLADTAQFLARATGRNLPPDEAAPAFRRLMRRHRDVRMELVWEFEGYHGTVHYDALLHVDGATLSLACSPDGGVPWAMRHAHHAREADLLRVNGRTLNVQTVMGYLDWIWQDAALVTSLVDGCLVRDAIRAMGVAAADAEVSRAVEAFKRANGITSRRAEAAWLRRRGWTPDDLKYEVRRLLVARHVKTRLARGRVRAYFERHRVDLAIAVVARLQLRDRELAQHMGRRWRSGDMAASAIVEESVLAGDREPAAYTCEVVRRRDLSPPAARAVFSAANGAVVGPFPSNNGYDVIRVLGTASPRLDGPTRDLIVDLLFAEWIEARRAEATVEWFWGDAERATGQADTRGRTR